MAHAGAAGCLIRGTVVDFESGKPVAKAKVYAKPEGKPAAILRITDDQGAFCFDLLDAAAYQVVADHFGYLPALFGARPGDEDGMPVKVDEAGELPPLVLKMIHAASIAGVALHANGEPLDGADVELSRKGWDHGWKASSLTNERTDDRGNFRFTKLAPGNYYLSVHPRYQGDDGAVLDEKGQPVRAGEGLTYYAASATFEHATPITLKPGQEIAGVTLAISAIVPRRLSGRVAGYTPNPQMRLDVIVSSDDDDSSSTPIRPDGTFSVEGLEPRRYSVWVRGQSAKSEVDLTNGDVDGFAVETKRNLEVQLSVRVENQPAQKADVQLQSIGGAWIRKQEGECCTFHNVPPEVYRLEPNGGSLSGKYYLKALLVNGHAQPDNLLDLRGSAAGPIEAVLSTKVARIEGRTDALTGAASGLAVTIVVMDVAISKVEVTGPTEIVNQTGKFSFESLAAGKYRVFAIEGFESDPWGSPELAAALAGKSVEVELGEGDKKQIKLPVISSGEWEAALRKVGM
jgi:Carboxypeptidase regulatory-like domain